jgi:uncharacterized protein YsxB (DUF464 family)
MQSLEELLRQSPSISDEELEYWLFLLPTMKEEHRERLLVILETEKRKLEDLDYNFSI